MPGVLRPIVTLTISQTSRNISELTLPSVFHDLPQANTYDLESSDDREISIFFLQIIFQISIPRPWANYGNEWTKTSGITIYTQNISMVQSCACFEFTEYSLKILRSGIANQTHRTFEVLTLDFFFIVPSTSSEIYTSNDFTATCYAVKLTQVDRKNIANKHRSVPHQFERYISISHRTRHGHRQTFRSC
jgi:hypothetical protein